MDTCLEGTFSCSFIFWGHLALSVYQFQAKVTRRSQKKALFVLDNEEVLLEWVHERRFIGFRVLWKMIKRKARFLHNDKCNEMDLPPTFTASIGWLQKFMTRYGLCIQRMTTESQKDHEKLIGKLIAYVLQTRWLLVTFSNSNSDIKAMNTRHTFQHNCWLSRPQHDSYENNRSRNERGFILLNSESRWDEIEVVYLLSWCWERNQITQWRIQG